MLLLVLLPPIAAIPVPPTWRGTGEEDGEDPSSTSIDPLSSIYPSSSSVQVFLPFLDCCVVGKYDFDFAHQSVPQHPPFPIRGIGHRHVDEAGDEDEGRQERRERGGGVEFNTCTQMAIGMQKRLTLSILEKSLAHCLHAKSL